MSASGTGSKSKGKRPRKKGGNSMAMLLWLLLPVGFFVASTSLLVVVGMLPTVVAYVVDTDEDKTAGMTVGALNFCGVLPFIILLWRKQATLATAVQMISDPLTLMIMYGAAGAGWALYFTVPPAVANFEAARAEARIEELKAQKRSLIQEWGTEVMGEKDDHGPGPASGKPGPKAPPRPAAPATPA